MAFNETTSPDMRYSTRQTGSVLMVEPDHFRIEYAINPHMKSADGQLKEVHGPTARAQWENLRKIFTGLGLTVHTLPAVAGLPDMVFAANQSFPFIQPSRRPGVLMSHMTSPRRTAEVKHFEDWYQKQGYEIFHLENPDLNFEGNGDAFFHPDRPLVFGGFGFRTDREAYAEISRRWGFEILPVQLKHAEFYHLDTCFTILNSETAAVVPEAIDPNALAQIQKIFSDVIMIDWDEALMGFAANSFCANGRDVVIPQGNEKFRKELQGRGFHVLEADTGEFIKAGGSVFCLKMSLPLGAV